MIEVKLIAKPKGAQGGTATGSGGSAQSVSVADEAKHAAKADLAQRAQQADYADKAGTASRAMTADKAGDVADDSPVYDRFLRKDSPDTAAAAITFLQGLLIGDGSYGITAQGNATLADLNAAVAHIATAAITEMASRTNFLQGASFAEQAAFAKGLLSGLVRSDNYVQGLSGFSLENTAAGHSRLEVDELLVRVKAIFNELEIRKLSYAGGNMELSGAGSTIVRVRPLVREGEAEPYAWRCFLLKDDGTTRTRNWWRMGDMAKCQTFNLDGEASPTARLLSLGGRLISADAAGSPLGYGQARQGNAGNRYYWRLVTATGTETLEDGRDYDYVELSNEKEVVLTAPDGTEVRCQGYDEVFDGFDLTDSGMKWHADANDAPQEGDEIVQEGNQLDTDRQHIIRLVTVGENAPAIQEYCGVGAHDGLGVYTLSPRLMTQLAPRTGNIFRARRFEIETESGAVTRLPVYQGQWQQGKAYYYYEQVSHQGSLWLCTSQKGTTAEPAQGSAAWQLQVAKGDTGDPGHDGTDGKDGTNGTDGAISAVRAYFTPAALAINEQDGGSFDLSQALLDITVIRGFQEEITGSCTFSYNATGCTVEQGDYPFQCRITAITGQPERATVKCNVRVPANYAGGTPDTMQCSADIAINYLGSFRETIENDVKTQIASKSFSYIDGQGQIQTIEGISRLVQSAQGLTSEVWRRQPAGSVIANGAFTDGMEKWAGDNINANATTDTDGTPCAELTNEGSGTSAIIQYTRDMLSQWQQAIEPGQQAKATIRLRACSETGCTIGAELFNSIDGTLASWQQALPAAQPGEWTRAEATLEFSQPPTGLRVTLTSAGSASPAGAACLLTDVQLIPDTTQALASKIEQTAESIQLSVAAVDQGLMDTGINIQDRLIRVNADNFIISNNQGEQTMRIDEDGQLAIRQLKVAGQGKARIEASIDAEGNPLLIGYDRQGNIKWVFDGSEYQNYTDNVTMEVLPEKSAFYITITSKGEARTIEVEVKVVVKVTNMSHAEIEYNGEALQCRVDDWRTAGGAGQLTIAYQKGGLIPAQGSGEVTFESTHSMEYWPGTTARPAILDATAIRATAYYNDPADGWKARSEADIPRGNRYIPVFPGTLTP